MSCWFCHFQGKSSSMRFGRVSRQSREHVSEPSLWTTFRTATYAPQKKKRYPITSSAAGSPEKQKINDDEGCDYATGAEGEHVANVVSGHALACLDCSFDDPFVVPFRHQSLSLLR